MPEKNLAARDVKTVQMFLQRSLLFRSCVGQLNAVNNYGRMMNGRVLAIRWPLKLNHKYELQGIDMGMVS